MSQKSSGSSQSVSKSQKGVSGLSKSSSKSESTSKRNSKSSNASNGSSSLHESQQKSKSLGGKECSASYSKSGQRSKSFAERKTSKSLSTKSTKSAGLKHPGLHAKSSRSTLGPVHINNLTKLHLLQKSIVNSRIMPKSGKGKSKSGRSANSKSSDVAPRARLDPRSMKRNDNIPIEASAAHISETAKEAPVAGPLATIDSALLPVNIYNADVRYEFQAKVMHCLAGTLYDPDKFLKPVAVGATNTNYLEREVDPHKLIEFMVKHMNLYYDLEADPDPFSSRRQEMDNVLWDNLAFIIPMLCRQVINVVGKDPMILTDVEPDVIIFGDIHGNFNDIYYIYKNFIINPEYANTRFLFLGDYVDRGPKPVEIVCLLFALKLAYPNRFTLLRGNHEVLKINRKYGFQHMCCHLFLDTYVARPTLAELNYKSFNRAFCYMPVAAVIKGSAHTSGAGTSAGGSVKRIFCCHGGIPSYYKDDKNRSKSRSSKSASSMENTEMDVGWSITTLNASLSKPASLAPTTRGTPSERAFNEILWNDPIPFRLRDPEKFPRKFYINKKRGGHCSFFTEAGLKAFFKANDLSMIIRGHQYLHTMENGYSYDFDGAMLTVFSSSNYCGTEENATGYVHVKGSECQVKAHTLRTIEEAEKYRNFNILKIIVDEKTQAVTQVAF